MGDGEDTMSLRVSVLVEAAPEAAFDAFTTRVHEWWVREFTWSGRDLLDTIGIEPGPGGKAYEIGPHGFRLDWGRVLVWDPPRRVVLAWQIAPDRVPRPDPAQASEVDVSFRQQPGGTAVTLEHRHFERHGPDAAGYRRAMTDGWRELLDRYAETCRAA
ncbi:MAG TPA: SRPBCC family protein, partial [Actinoplanes sp.]